MKDNSVEMSVLFDFYGPMLTLKQQHFFDHYHNNDLSLAEIAENEGITRQGVRDVLQRGEHILRDMEDRLGLAARMLAHARALDSIREAARAISDVNARRYASDEICDRADDIVRLCDGAGGEGE